ncbi:MAG: RNase P subunit p30 family protein [Candidatus Helarchaeota archaeon]
MKNFYDLNLSSTLSSGRSEPEEILDTAVELGFSGVALADFENFSPKIAKKFRNRYQKRLRIFTRATIEPRTTAEMKYWVQKLRNQVDILAVKNGSDEKKVYINAILDKRVDIISLIDQSDYKLEYAHFKMAKKNATLIEVVGRNLIIQGGIQRSKLMRQMIKSIGQILRAEAPFIISSGARSKWEMRGPFDLVALTNLVKIPEVEAIKGVSSYPEKLIEKIKMIRDPNYIMAGIRIVTTEGEGKGGE